MDSIQEARTFFGEVKAFFADYDLGIVLLGNTITEYLIWLGVIVGFTMFRKLFRRAILNYAEPWANKTENRIDNLVVDILKNFFKRGFFYYAIFVGSTLAVLQVEQTAEEIMLKLLILWLAVEVVLALMILITTVTTEWRMRLSSTRGASSSGIVTVISSGVKAAVWLIASLMVLDNLGFDITTFVAGLGVGGLAIAFALQNIFADVFATICIFLDKPYEVGDYIIVGSMSGTVEKIGIRSTRIRTLPGQIDVIPNKTLADAEIENLNDRKNRRQSIGLGVTYETTNDQIRSILGGLEEIVNAEPHVEFVRAYFVNYGASSKDIDFVFNVTTSDYNIGATAKQNILFAIQDLYDDVGAEMPFNTQTLHIETVPEAMGELVKAA